MINNYFKTPVEGLRKDGGAFFFFDDSDRGSIEVAFAHACEAASSPSRVAVWREPLVAGSWTRLCPAVGDPVLSII